MQPTVLGLPPDVEQLLGRGHLLVLHFPIALLLAAALLEMIHRLRRTGKPSPSALACCLLGTLGALLAATTGWLYAEYDPPGRSLEETLFWHRWGGVGTAGVATLTLLVGLAARGGQRPRATGWFRAFLLLSAGSVAFVASQGGDMGHGEGFFDVLGSSPTRAGTSAGAPPGDTGLSPSTPDDREEEPEPATGSQAGTTPAPDGDAPAPDGAPPADAGGASGTVAAAATGFDFTGRVAPIFEARCIECHGPAKRKGRLRLDLPDDVFAGPPHEWLVQPGRPDASELLRLVELPEDDLDRMPGKGPPLRAEQIATLRAWIAAGAPWPGRPDGGAAGDAAPDAGRTAPPATATPDAAAPGSASDGVAETAPPDAATAAATSDGGAEAAPPAGDGTPPGAQDGGEALALPASEADRLAEQAALGGLVARGALAARVAPGERAVEVDFGLLGEDAGDDDLALLAGLEPVLVWLGLQGTAVTDEGLANLAGFTELRRLNLSRTGVGDAGLVPLAGLPALETLNLYGTRVTDEGLAKLAELASLRRLFLWDTEVTAEGVAALRERLPGLEVDVGLDTAGDGEG